MQPSTHCSCACSGTCDWTNTVHRAGSRPSASSWATALRVRARERLRVVLDGERVQVGDEVERVVVVLQGHPLPHRTEVVAEVERVRGGLDAREHPRAAIGGHGTILPRRPGDFAGAAVGWSLVEVITVGPGLAARSFPGERTAGAPRARALVQRPAVGRGGRATSTGHPVVAVDLRGHGASAEVPDVEPDATLAAAARPRRGVRRPRLEGAGRRGPVVGRQRRAPARRRIGRCTASRWSTGDGCSCPTASPRSTTPGPCSRPAVRRAHRRGPPRPAAHRPSGLVGRGRRRHGGQLADPRRRHGRAVAHPRTAPRDRRQHARAQAAGAVRAGRVPGAAPGGGRGQPGGVRGRGGRCRTPSWSRSPAAITTCTPSTRKRSPRSSGGWRERPAGDHGVGRDRADHGRGAPRHPARRGRGAVAAARHPVRLPGERRRHHPEGRGVLRAQRRRRGRRRWSGAPGSTGPRSTARSPPSARPARCSRGRAARRTPCACGRAPGSTTRSRRVAASGGTVTFASAAALTIGVVSVPVYEIYKSGADPAWAQGTNLLERLTGLRAALIPHYDNTEGGTHSTRFCYLGERRLRFLEGELPAGRTSSGWTSTPRWSSTSPRAWRRVLGNGTVTVRHDGESRVLPSGTVRADRRAGRAGGGGRRGRGRRGSKRRRGRRLARRGTAGARRRAWDGRPPSCEPASDACARPPTGRGPRSTSPWPPATPTPRPPAVLDLEQAITDWTADTLQSDDGDHARRTLRGMVLELAAAARDGLADPAARMPRSSTRCSNAGPPPARPATSPPPTPSATATPPGSAARRPDGASPRRATHTAVPRAACASGTGPCAFPTQPPSAPAARRTSRRPAGGRAPRRRPGA